MSFFDRWRGLHWDPPGNLGWLFILLGVAAVAYAVVVYRRTEAPLTVRYRSLLTGLRALALLTLIAILCRPVVSLALAGGAARGVLVLLDRSESMVLPGRDAGGTRDDELRRAAVGIRSELGGSYPVTFRPFEQAVGPEVDPGAVPPPTGAGTDLAGALEEGMAQGPAGRPGAMILVSDGAATEGPDPVPLARRLGIPIQAVALGSPRPVPDLALTRVRVNREAFTGERTPLEAVLRLQGLPGSTVRVQLLDVTDQPVELASAQAALEPDGAEHRVDLSFVPSQPGLRFLEVRVPGLPDEATAANNRRLVAVMVREEKTGALILTGNLTWDHTFIRRALEADSTLSVTAAFWKGGRFQAVPGSKPVPPLSASGLRDVRLIVLDHVTPGQLGPEGARAVAGFVHAGGGLFMVSGSATGDLGSWRGSALADLLPVQLSVTGGGDEEQLRLTPDGRRSVLFDPAVPGAPPLDAWADLPPVGVAEELGPLKGRAEALLVDTPAQGNRAVLSWMRSGQGRVLLFAGAGMWKWDFAGAEHGPTGRIMPGWWRRAAHWLARPDLETRVDVHPEDYVVARGKPVTFVARVTDEAYRPIPDAEVEVTVTPAAASDQEPQSVSLSGSEGILSGAFENLDPGRYRFTGRARSGSNALGTVEGVFAVDSLGTEMERLEADHELLARVAEAGNGRLWSPDSLGALGDTFRSISQAEEERVQVALWDSPWVFALFVLFASLEWLLRRRRGLV